MLSIKKACHILRGVVDDKNEGTKKAYRKQEENSAFEE